MPLDISSAFLINSNRFTGVYGLVHSWMDSAIILYVSPSLRGSPGWGADLLASVNLVDGPVSSAHQSTPFLAVIALAYPLVCLMYSRWWWAVRGGIL